MLKQQHQLFVELEKWRKRGLWHKLKDNVFYIFNEML